ncbi:glycosyltransferase [Clostridium beijerinckii]|uniref:glycosyltransferase n=1 Tax=Clostridium beijerinckii TaxID=1520 RepID=UPI0013615950|nr:glycosyltransferase family 2 protein [Clostridium beijerinckii]MZK50038.1 glycosyltransferase [Clostridium beijerinckii]MZK58162.1 glycosyltransferase [Clostridium beijerinckii]MZK68504.1 glycosyltransferase [Clostridium beijerinckii]MZK73754.1 glycosyltransferase [Clostridium beijerinckii]MZK83410.1 glycosyltransferase [Clostridium beijerinckii]
MITVSLCMIVKNEEDTIGRCLDSIKDVVDEIIIADTGSTDKTKEICSKYTSNVYDFKWIDDFSAARNFSFSKASKDYILWLDADDVLLPEDAEKFKSLKETLDTSVDSVTAKYNIGFDEYGNVTMSYRRNRLVKRENNFKWIGFVHEYLQVAGNIINSDIAITHKKLKQTPKRNLDIYKGKLKEGLEFTPRDTLYYANELYDHNMYDEALKYYNKFLDLKQGWFEDNIRVCGKICDYYQSVNKVEDARKYAFKSFEYDTPRAEACCKIGFSFLHERKYKQAAFWYEEATKLEKPKDSWGFFNDACWTWLPHLQLCVCYDKLGDHKLAYEHNEIAGKFRPNDRRILYNKKYFKDIGVS